MPYASVNGLAMYHEVRGEGPPLLLLHGGTGSIPEEWVPLFSPRFRVIAPEFMGHGRTADAVDRPFHYHDLAEDIAELMRQLEIERAVIVGYSDGGIVGLDLAIHHPERVSRLVTTGANTRVDGYTAENIEWIRTFDAAGLEISETYARLSPDGPEHWPVLLTRLRPMWMVEPHFTDDDLRRIGVPTLIVIGDQDIVTPEHAVEMFRTIPHAQLCVVPHAGHGAMPADVVLRFLEETTVGQST